MHIISFVDKYNGTMFDGRRQTKDRLLIDYIKCLTQNNKLWCSTYSGSLFETKPENLVIDDEFLSKAGIDDFCIIEGQSIQLYLDKIKTIRLYRWNKKYPSTESFSVDNLIDLENVYNIDLFLEGTHKCIKEEIWVNTRCIDEK